MATVCSFFGHRDVGEQIRPALAAEIEQHIAEHGVDTFYVGGYGHFDGMAAGILRELQKKYSHIAVFKILAYIPTGNTEHADDPTHTIFPDGLEFVPRRFAITHRNRWIVEASEYVIACVTFRYGGAYEALKYAKHKRKTVVNLAELNKHGGE